MAESTHRIRRLLADELGDCRDEDVERRLAELRSLADAAFAEDPSRAVFSALGDGTRYRLVRALAVAEADLCVCELEPLVAVGESAVSHALADLVEAGLLARRKEGNWRYYRATDLAEAVLETADRRVGGDA